MFLHYCFFFCICFWKIRKATSLVSIGKKSNDFSTLIWLQFPIDRKYGKKENDCLDIFDNYCFEEVKKTQKLKKLKKPDSKNTIFVWLSFCFSKIAHYCFTVVYVSQFPWISLCNLSLWPQERFSFCLCEAYEQGCWDWKT